MREVDPDTTFNRAVQRSQIATVCLESRSDGTERIYLAGERNRRDRIDPRAEADRGLDPFHTPEDGKTRLTGYLREGVTIDPESRTLVLPQSPSPHLSPATAGIPFLEYDDPRRILLGAKHRTRAVEVAGRQDSSADENRDRSLGPPGVTLRVGYLAWRGLNHEDAWVISRSAATKFRSTRRTTCHIAIPAYELKPEGIVALGDRVEKGRELLRRGVAPAFLVTDVDILARAILGEGGPLWAVGLPSHDNPRAPHGGEVVEVQRWDLARGMGYPEDVKILPGTLRYLREVVVITIKETLDLQVGDKLANSHGNKGIVGAILPDDDMPRWRGEPLEALIDPVSVLNRANWGQVREALQTAEIDVSADGGRSDIEPPPLSSSNRWMEHAVKAVAGLQHVMRLDNHARDALSPRRQRIGELGTFALWGYGWGTTGDRELPRSPELSEGAASIQRLLRTAGVELSVADGELVFRLMDLSKRPGRDVS